MSNELDIRARRASTNLMEMVDSVELMSQMPGRRRVRMALRPALVAALVLIGAAVGLALVLDSPPTPITTTVPAAPVLSTTPAPTTPTTSPTVGSTAAPYVPPTTAAAAPLSPTTTLAADLEPPALTITAPENGAVFDEKLVTFAGTTEPGARVFAGKYEAEVSASGEWHILLVLGEGTNVARFIARDSAGNEAQATVTVHYVVAEPETTTTVAKEETPTTAKEGELPEFTAYATFGSCSETPPYDVYHGSGAPGSLVSINSEHGSGIAEVGPQGHWEVKVIFETAPPGEVFPVKVTDEFGRSTQFEFVYTP